MSEMDSLPSNPDLMSARDTALVVVDVQQKLIGLIPGHERIVWNIRRLIDGAGVLGVPVIATEQYPRGLGATVPELAERLGEVYSKLTFSCTGCPDVDFAQSLRARGIHKLLLAGIETHVCVQQSVLDLMAAGMRVYLAVDAVGSRGKIDHETALGRMDSAGATLTTTEAAMFEWCRVAGTPEFKKISTLVKETAPA
jgi:nicotinamidase-related amidase